jgi:hypothetical protein
MELVAALAVNVPGFPIPRLQIAASASEVHTLTAAGVVERPKPAQVTVADIVAGFTALVDAFKEMGRRVNAALGTTPATVEMDQTKTAELARTKLRAVRAAQARSKLHV